MDFFPLKMLWFSSYVAKVFFFLRGCQWIIAIYFFYYNIEVLYCWNVFNPYRRILRFIVLFDAVGVVFSATVLLISGSVFMFSCFYMRDEAYLKRFTILVILFVMSINFFIFIPHIMFLLLGWDGLGLVSFYLVIYYQNAKSLAGGILTVLRNRVGDVIILLSIAFRFNQGQWLIINMSESRLILGALILIAGITKSAQLPFSSWLPAAIAAPTPVSALVHSSTLVTAGVFLLIRFYEIILMVDRLFRVLLFVSSLTMIMARIAALVEQDMKKIIALSTLRQLGLIIIILSLGFPSLAFFHLLVHALFKALLFIAAGSLIHLGFHGQDLRSFGNLSSQLPIVSAAILAANLALIRIPFIGGYYTKDILLEYLWIGFPPFMLCLILIRVPLTVMYRVRMIILVLWVPKAGVPLQKLSDNVKELIVPLIVMSIGTILGGALLNWLLILDGLTLVPIQIKWLPHWPFMVAVLTVWGVITQTASLPIIFDYKLLKYIRSRMWFFTPLSTQYLVSLGIISGTVIKVIDHGWLEIRGPQGVYKLRESWHKIFQVWRGNGVFVFLLLGRLLILRLIML